MAAPVRIETLETVDSTNAECFRRADAGDLGRLWVRAVRQSAGRGRQGRAWVSEPGNLYASLLLRDPAPPERLGQLPLVVALAVHDAVAVVLAPPLRPDLTIKWPNDLLLAGAKVAGILIEGRFGNGGQQVVVGIGVNCTHHPDASLYPTTSLAAAGQPTDAAALLGLLADRMETRLAEWEEGAFPAIREAWLARARGLGEPIRVRLQSETLDGRFRGLDADGRLLLDMAAGPSRVISAGDVFFG